MYLSRVELDPTERRTLRLVDRVLASPTALHQLVLAAHGTEDYARPRDGDHGVLYRRELARAGATVVLVQSATRPDWTRGMAGEVCGVRRPAVKEIDPQLRAGDRLRFRLRANPTRRQPGRGLVDPETGKPKLGPRVSVANVGPRRERAVQQCEELRGYVPSSREVNEWLFREWLEERLLRVGAVLEVVQVTDEGLLQDPRRGLQLQSVLFDGVLAVQAPALLRIAIEQGIGSGKGFGFGLLSLTSAG